MLIVRLFATNIMLSQARCLLAVLALLVLSHAGHLPLLVPEPISVAGRGAADRALHHASQTRSVPSTHAEAHSAVSHSPSVLSESSLHPTLCAGGLAVAHPRAFEGCAPVGALLMRPMAVPTQTQLAQGVSETPALANGKRRALI